MKPLYESVFEKDFTYEDFLKEENNKIEFIERTFDLENKKLTFRMKEKKYEIEESISYFEFVNENIVKILDQQTE